MVCESERDSLKKKKKKTEKKKRNPVRDSSFGLYSCF